MLPLFIDIILMARKYRIIYKLFELIIKLTMGLNTRSLFLIICISLLKNCVSMCLSLCGYFVWVLVPTESRRGHHIPRRWSWKQLQTSCRGHWELNLDFLQGQHIHALNLWAICSSFSSVVGCDKPFGLNRNQRRKVLLHLRGYDCPSSREAKTGTQAGIWRQEPGGTLLLARLMAHVQLSFLHSSGPATLD